MRYVGHCIICTLLSVHCVLAITKSADRSNTGVNEFFAKIHAYQGRQQLLGQALNAAAQQQPAQLQLSSMLCRRAASTRAAPPSRCVVSRWQLPAVRRGPCRRAVQCWAKTTSSRSKAASSSDSTSAQQPLQQQQPLSTNSSKSVQVWWLLMQCSQMSRCPVALCSARQGGADSCT